MTEGGNWNCDKCRTGHVRMLQEDLQIALRQIDELKVRNRELGTKLLLAGNGKRDTGHGKQTFTKCMVGGDWVLQNVGAKHADMMVECFQGDGKE